MTVIFMSLCTLFEIASSVLILGLSRPAQSIRNKILRRYSIHEQHFEVRPGNTMYFRFSKKKRNSLEKFRNSTGTVVLRSNKPSLSSKDARKHVSHNSKFTAEIIPKCTFSELQFMRNQGTSTNQGISQAK